MERPINQIALSVSSLPDSLAWYGALGLEATGGFGPAGGPEIAEMLRMPAVESSMKWLVGRNPMMQLELFQFAQPRPKPLSLSRTALDQGYGSISIFVADFATHLERLGTDAGAYELTGAPGSRSLWVRDPDNIPVEILERDMSGLDLVKDGGKGLAGIRAVSVTVPDLAQAADIWTSSLGFSEVSREDYVFNPLPSWWNGGAAFRDHVLKGGSVLIRLLSPGDGKIVARPSGSLLSDIGVLNIAAISLSAEDHKDFSERLRRSGFDFAIDKALNTGPDSGLLYGNDPLGNNVETGYLRPGTEEDWGWRR